MGRVLFMQVKQVVVGATYLVHVPQRDHPDQYVTHDPERAEIDLALVRLSIRRDNDFDITVTETGLRLGDEVAVAGIRVVDTSRVSVPLEATLAAELGSADRRGLPRRWRHPRCPQRPDGGVPAGGNAGRPPALVATPALTPAAPTRTENHWFVIQHC